MPNIDVNDILEELIDENKRLLNDLLFANNCLKKFIEFKSFIEIIFNRVNNYLKPNDRKRFKDLNNDIQKTFDGKQINNLNQTKSRINFQENFEINALKSEEPIGEDIHISEDNETQKVLDKNLNNNLMNNEITVKSEEYCIEINSDEDTDNYEPEQLSDRSETCDEDTDNDKTPKEGLLECDIDGFEEIFNSRSDLRKYRRSCNSNKRTKPITTEYRCYDMDSLNMHIKRHINNRRFKCSWPGCQWKITHKKNKFNKL